MGVLRTSHSPKGTLGWEGQWDYDVSGGTQESKRHPIVPRGLWDVLTGLRNGDGKSGQHSHIQRKLWCSQLPATLTSKQSPSRWLGNPRRTLLTSSTLSSQPSTVLPANSPSTYTHPLIGISPPSTRTQTLTCPSPALCVQRPSPRNEAALVILPSTTRKKALKLQNTRAATSATSVVRVSPQSAAWHTTAEELMLQKNQLRWLPKSQSKEQDAGQKKSTNGSKTLYSKWVCHQASK